VLRFVFVYVFVSILGHASSGEKRCRAEKGGTLDETAAIPFALRNHACS
jgi:hypothetical protein